MYFWVDIDDAVVLFIDSDGIVLVDKQYDDILDYILMNISSFNDFYKYKWIRNLYYHNDIIFMCNT